MKILAFDPGITTGYAVGYLDVEKGLLTIGASQEKFSHDVLLQYLIDTKPNLIIYEKFEYRNRARPGLELFSRELIGIIKLYYAYNSFSTTLVEQTPAQAMGYFTDKKLKELEIYQPGKPHAMDALRHLLQWYQFGAGYQYNKLGFKSI
jgi:hypothetical protein